MIRVNGRDVAFDGPGDQRLVDWLRDDLGLTGAHKGCETGQCGACTVHLDGKAVKACMVLAAQAEERRVTTIKGLAPSPDSLHPLQEAFRDHHGLQCGFCTPGMVMAALSWVGGAEGPVSEEHVREALKGNLCRCTGYQGIVEAILDYARTMTEPLR